MARKIEIEIVGDAKNFQSALGKASGSADGFGSSLAKMGKLAAIAIGAAGIGGIAIVLKQGIAEFSQAAKVGAQTNAVLESTGGIANVTAGEVSKLASALMAKSGVDDEAIQSGENMLLTFTKVRNEVGAGNDIFDQGTKAALNMSVALGKDMPASALLVGKALNDPIKGMTALTRAGIQFTDEQKKTIKGMVETGNVMGAQKIILKELTTQFGGSAEALGKTLPGQLNILKETFNNLAGTMVGAMVPAFTKVVEGASQFLTKFGEAEGASAKFGVAMDAIKTIASDAAAGLVATFNAIDWAKMWDKLVLSAGTVATRLRDALDQKLGAVDWGNVGTKIADGISAAISTTGSIGKKIADVVGTAMRSVDWVSFGKAAGPGLAAALVTAFATLMDVSFWIKNWDLALAVGLAVFGKGLGKLVAPMGVALKGALSKAWDDAVVAIAGAVERWFPKIASVLASVLGRLPAIVAAGLAKLVSPVTSAFAKLGKLAQFTVRVLGLAAVINAITAFVTAAANKFKELIGIVLGFGPQLFSAGVSIARQLVSGILSGISGLPAQLGGKLKGYIDSAIGFAGGLLRGSGEFMFTKHRIGEPMAQGIVDGFDGGLARFSPRMVAATAAVFDRIKAMVDSRIAVLNTAWAKIGEGIDRAFGAKTQQLLTNLSSAWDVQINKVRAWATELTNAERALSAFDLAGQAQTMSELALATMDAAEAERSRQQALSAAGAALSKAQAMPTGEDAKQVRELADAKQDLAAAQAKNAGASTEATLKTVREAGQKVADLEKGLGAETLQRAEERSAAILAAEESLRSANLAITRAGLQAQATLERDALAAKRVELAAAAQQEREQRDLQAAERIAAMEAQKAAELQNLEEFRRIQGEQLALQLAQLQTHLAKNPKEWSKTQAAIVKLLKGYGIDYKNSGELLGNAFASGLKASEKAVEAAANNLAKIPKSYLQLKSPAEKGPLSTINSWFKPMGPMLAKQMNGSALAGAASRMASGAAMGGPSMAMAGAGARGGGGYAGPERIILQVDGRTLAEVTRKEWQRSIARNK